MLLIRLAQSGEAEALTDLCLRSKAVWGYDGRFIAACRKELSVTPADLSRSYVPVAEVDGRIVGVAQLSLNGDIAQLEKLFVEPACLRSGVGRALFDWCASTARAFRSTVLIMESDPDAAPFYRRMGAVDDGNVRSGSIPGRFIPRLKLDLTRSLNR